MKTRDVLRIRSRCTIEEHGKLFGELKVAATGATDLVSFEAINSRVKRVGAAAEMVNIYISKGAEHQQFLQVYDAQLHFLNLSTALQDDFPPFFHSAALVLKASALSGQAFWETIKKGSVAEVGIQQHQMNELRQKVLTTKLLTIAKLPNVQEVHVALKGLLECRCWQGDETDYSEEVRTAMDVLYNLSFAEHCEDEVVKISLDRMMAKPGVPIASLLLELPKGQAFARAISDGLDARKMSQAQVVQWGNHVAAYKLACSNEDVEALSISDFQSMADNFVKCHDWLAVQAPTLATIGKLHPTQSVLEECILFTRKVALHMWHREFKCLKDDRTSSSTFKVRRFVVYRLSLACHTYCFVLRALGFRALLAFH